MADAKRSAVPFDYRASHTQLGKGARYDAMYAPGSALAFYWDNFERPLLEAEFASARAEHPGGRYLDFACGTGRILNIGAQYFEDSVGIDVSREMTVIAREKCPSARVLEADVLRDHVDVGEFDVATLFRFLLRAGHLREEIIAYLATIVRPGATLITNNHRNATSLRGLVYRIHRRLWPDGYEHEVLSDREVQEMLGRHGFEVVRSYGFGLVPSFHGHLLLPTWLLLPIERRAAGSGWLSRFTKNRVYTSRFVGRREPTAATSGRPS